MRKLTFLAALLFLMPAAAVADSATANFQGNCTHSGDTVSCTFDAQRPTSNPSACPDSFIWKYSWDFGDGSSSGLTGNNQVQHDYDDSGDYFPKLTVFCWGEGEPTKIRDLCIQFGSPGCIQVGVGWN